MGVTVSADMNKYTAISLEAQGRLVAVAVRRPTLERPAVPVRGEIKGFSVKSRKRLMRKTARIGARTAVFLTLTYPKRYPTPYEAKKHLRAFLERIRRRWPESSAIWRLEFQERGAPHFHLIFYNLPFIPFPVVRAWWSHIIRRYVDGFMPRVNLKFLRDVRAVSRYVSKYVAKADSSSIFISGPYLHATSQQTADDLNGRSSGPCGYPYIQETRVGRFWGIFNAPALPMAMQIHVTFQVVTEVCIRDILTRLSQVWEGVDPNWTHGVALFDDSAYATLMELIHLISPDLVRSGPNQVVVKGETDNGSKAQCKHKPQGCHRTHIYLARAGRFILARGVGIRSRQSAAKSS